MIEFGGILQLNLGAQADIETITALEIYLPRDYSWKRGWKKREKKEKLRITNLYFIHESIKINIFFYIYLYRN